MNVKRGFAKALVLLLGISSLTACYTSMDNLNQKEALYQQMTAEKYPGAHELSEAYLSSYDLNMAVKKGLCKTNKKLDLKYIKLQALYKRGLSWYLEETLDLAAYDQQMRKQSLEEHAEEKRYDYLKSPYFYVLSPCYIERLDETEIKALETLAESEQVISRDSKEGKQLMNLVLQTYPDVACEGKTADKEYQFFFDDNSLYKTNSHAILLGLGITIHPEDSAWSEKREYIKEIKAQVERKAKDGGIKSDLTVCTFVH